jgi:DNA-binding protein
MPDKSKTPKVSEEPRRLNIGNKPPEIYMNTANTIANQQGFVIIRGLGQAVVTVARLANILHRNFGLQVDQISLGEEELEKRIPDPNIKDALRQRKFISTGEKVWKPHLTIRLVKQTSSGSK